MKKLNAKMIIRMLFAGLVVFTILYFTVLKTLKVKSDRNTIYNMYGAEYSDATLAWKIRWLSSKNINSYSDIISVASASICNNNTKILELIDRKGGEFILQNLRSAYVCEADNSIAFLEKKGFSVLDNDLQVPKFILANALRHGDYSEPAIKHLKTMLDRNEELKSNPELIGILQAVELGAWDVLQQEKGVPPLRDVLLSYFSVDESVESEKPNNEQ